MPRVYATRWVKIEATGSTRFYNTLWKKNLFGSHLLIHLRTHTLGSAGNPTLSQFDDSDTQLQTLCYCTTEASPDLIHWWVVYATL